AELPDRIRNVVPQPGNIGETQVEDLDVVLLDECHDCLRIRLGISHSGSPCCRACTLLAARAWVELPLFLMEHRAGASTSFSRGVAQSSGVGIPNCELHR